MSLKLVSFDLTRPLTKRERDVFEKRRNRVREAKDSRSVATANLRKLAETSGLSSIRIRKGFIRLDQPLADDLSDRSAPPHDCRPPATRLFAPRGIALQLMLIALFEAQTRTTPGARSEGTKIPLRGEGSARLGWTKLLATSASTASGGKYLMTATDKQLRQVKIALARLEREGLVTPKDASRKTSRYEEFRLMYEDVLFGRPNDPYRVPADDEPYFEVPVELLTHGWVHVLEDSELALLLIAIYKRHQLGDEPYKLEAGTRALLFGLGRDSFDAHLMLQRLDLIDVDADPHRYDDGKVNGYQNRGAQPHALMFLPDSLNRDGGATVEEQLGYQLGR